MTIVKQNGNKSPKRLPPLQESFFLLGYHPTSKKEFPFASQRQRRLLWEKFRDSLSDMIYWTPERFEAPIMVPDASVLRPREWWKVEGFGLKLVLNGAILMKSEVNHIWDKDPAQETDYECLCRLNLLNERDKLKAATEAFQKAEAERIAYRSYLMETPVRTVQSIPSASTPTEREEISDVVIPELAEQVTTLKPTPPEPAGQCPRCERKLKGYSEEFLICVGCGALFDRSKLSALWRGVDSYRREKAKGHKIGFDD